MFSLLPKDQTFIFYLNIIMNKPRLLTVVTHSESIGNVYTGSVVGLLVNCLISIVYMIMMHIAAYWILYSEFGRVSCIDLFSTSAMVNLEVKQETSLKKIIVED